MLTIDGLTVEFSGVRPLDDVSLRFETGVSGLIGPNGAGKTTLINAVSGIVRPVSGRILWGDTDLRRMAAYRRARNGIRRTFQQNRSIDELSVADNVRIGEEHSGTGSLSTEGALQLLELADIAERPVGTLGGLNQRLVEIARAAVGSTQLLMLDEPGAGLDENETRHLATLLTRLAEATAATVIVIDHDMSFVRSVCTTLAVLDFGHVLAAGPTAAVLADVTVQRAYLGTEDVQ